MPTDPCREAFEAFDPGYKRTSLDMATEWRVWQAAWQARGDHDAAEHAASINRILDERK